MELIQLALCSYCPLLWFSKKNPCIAVIKPIAGIFGRYLKKTYLIVTFSGLATFVLNWLTALNQSSSVGNFHLFHPAPK